MRKTLLGLAGLAFLLGIVLAAAPVRAQSVDDKIKALEQELSELKSQQIDMKKDAAAAAAALPTFSYRPGNGLDIEAADKSWGFRASMETHLRMEFESGRTAIGRSTGEIMGRRWRPYFFYCINNCLWEIETALDLDGFGTGNAWNSTGTASTSILQRGALHLHAEQLNPWLPTVDVGMEVSTSISTARQGSSAIGAQAEYDILSRQAGPNTGRAGQGMVFNWDNRSLGAIGIPGRITRFQFAVAKISEGEDGRPTFTAKYGYNTYLGVEPFSQVKNKWIRGLKVEFGAWFCNNDGAPFVATGTSTAQVGSVLVTGRNVRQNGADNGCDRIRLRDHGDGASQTIFDTGAGSMGRGLYTYLMPGLSWNVGPYTLRAVGGFAEGEDKGGSPGKKRAHNFLIGHDLFLWSPKGFLTGSSSTPGSILIGTHFERNDASCDSGFVGCGGTINPLTGAKSGGINGGEFQRARLLLREWDLWYFVAPRMSVGVNWLWYDASNLRTGRYSAGANLGIFNGNCANTTACAGKGGDWMDVFLNWRYQF
ncbi:MAG: hypothetical protein ACM3TN_25860 [Alphaproteobacteria bacterium]